MTENIGTVSIAQAAERLREVMTRMVGPYMPSARELAGQDEVHLTSGDLAEMLRGAKEQAWAEGYKFGAGVAPDPRVNPHRSIP